MLYYLLLLPDRAAERDHHKQFHVWDYSFHHNVCQQLLCPPDFSAVLETTHSDTQSTHPGTITRLQKNLVSKSSEYK